MRLKVAVLLGAAVSTAMALAAPARAQTLDDRVTEVEKKVEDMRASIAKSLGIDFHTFGAIDYIYNFNNPKNQNNTFIFMNDDSNSFELNDVNISLGRANKDADLQFGISIDFGKTAELVGNATRWSNNPTATESLNSIELREAWGSYKLPFADDFPLAGTTIKAGKFVTLLGYEILRNFNAYNPNIDYSYLFSFGIPLTHTGFLFNWTGTIANAQIGVVNGWDNVVDNNSGKTLLAGFGLTPADILSIYISGTFGPEQTESQANRDVGIHAGQSKRGAVDGVITVTATDQLQFVVDALYGEENNVVPVQDPASPTGFGTPKDANWYGVAGYVIGKATDSLSLAMRAEVFDDVNGVRMFGTSNPFQDQVPPPHGETVWEITPTVAYQVTDGLLVRAEFRHDSSSANVFNNDNNGFRRYQNTIAAEAIYGF